MNSKELIRSIAKSNLSHFLASYNTVDINDLIDEIISIYNEITDKFDKAEMLIKLLVLKEKTTSQSHKDIIDSIALMNSMHRKFQKVIY